MLVVTRKLDESLIISDNIEITVLEIGKDKVKIGTTSSPYSSSTMAPGPIPS